MAGTRDAEEVGGRGGKGEMRGMKCITSGVVVMDSGDGAVNTPTSELSTRYPGGLRALFAVLANPPTCFLTVRSEREVDGNDGCTYKSEPGVTENRIVVIYAVWRPFASSTRLDTPTLIRLLMVEDFLFRTLNVNASSESAFKSLTCAFDSVSGKPRGQSASETAVNRFDVQE